MAYLYNGVRLPKLPEWDRETYPYAVVYANRRANISDWGFCLEVSDTQPYIGGNYIPGVDDAHNAGLTWGIGVLDLINYDAKTIRFYDFGEAEYSDFGASSYLDNVYIIWTNTPIYYDVNWGLSTQAGKLYLDASDVEEITENIPPFACIYNGVRLPPMPVDWDSKTYPYACIHLSDGSHQEYCFMAADRPFKYGEVESNGKTLTATYLDCSQGQSDEWQIASHTPVVWMPMKTCSGSSTTYRRTSTPAIWSNHPIFNEDGTTVFLAASDPVPVSTLDLQSLMAGWLVGKKIAAMRTAYCQDDYEVQTIYLSGMSPHTITVEGNFTVVCTDLTYRLDFIANFIALSDFCFARTDEFVWINTSGKATLHIPNAYVDMLLNLSSPLWTVCVYLVEMAADNSLISNQYAEWKLENQVAQDLSYEFIFEQGKTYRIDYCFRFGGSFQIDGNYISLSMSDYPYIGASHYRYNNIVMPDINKVWTDKNIYRYAVFGNGGLVLCSSPFYSEGSEVFISPEDTVYLSLYNLVNDKWVHVNTTSGDYGGISIGTLSQMVWTSEDIFDNNGRISFATSPPKPVDE